ncbi:MAG: hypothetical protein ACREK5_02295 [Gemmatimonadota bacterium]
MAPRSGSTDVYSVNYKAGYLICSADSLETFRQARTRNPDAAARWLAGDQKGEAYQGTYDGCLAGLLGEPSRFPAPPPPPRSPEVDAQYSAIEAALEDAGLTICEFLQFGANPGYGSEETRLYDVAVGTCPADDSEVEGNPNFGSIDIQVFQTVAARDNGATIHRNEIVNGRNFSGAAWTYQNILVELGHYVHPDFAERVRDTMSSLSGADSLYFRFK